MYQEYGFIDFLHYNAADLLQSNITEQPADTFLTDLSVNIAGTMVAIQSVIPLLLAQGKGTILLTGNRFVMIPVPDYISLSVGKVGLKTLALGLFDCFKSKGIHVCAVTASHSHEADSAWSVGVAQAFWQRYNTSGED